MPSRRVPAATIRKYFNAMNFDARLARGEVYQTVIRQAPPAAAANQPPGTLSQMVAYMDSKTGRQLAIVHQYLLPHGGIGGSGKPDPKWLVYRGKILIAEHQAPGRQTP